MTGNPGNAMVCDTPYLQNEFGDPGFFYVFNLILSFSTCSESFEKICTWELLSAIVLNIGQSDLSQCDCRANTSLHGSPQIGQSQSNLSADASDTSI